MSRFTIERDRDDYQWRIYLWGRSSALQIRVPGNVAPPYTAKFSTAEAAEAWLKTQIKTPCEVALRLPEDRLKAHEWRVIEPAGAEVAG